MGKPEDLTESDLRLKISSYCAYQERSPKQVFEKLSKLSSGSALIDKVYQWAQKEGFVSEKRFAENYVHGKFYLKKWGRYKIKAGLKNHEIQDEIIIKALSTIDDQFYMDTLINLGKKKWNSLKNNDPNRWEKMMVYLIGKGFEADLIKGKKPEITNE